MEKEKNSQLEEKLEQIQGKVDQIQEERQKERKTQRVMFYIKSLFVVILIIMLAVSLSFMKKSYEFFTSPKFLEALQYKTMEVMPFVTEQMGEKAKEVAPEIYSELESEINEYLPKLSQKITDKYIPQFLEELEAQSNKFVDKTLTKTENKLDTFLNNQIDEIVAKVETEMEKKGIDKMDKETINTLEKEIKKQMNSQLSNLTIKKFEDNMNQCITQGEKIFQSIEAFKEIPENERKEHAFEIFRGFVNGLEYMSTGKLPEGYATQFESEEKLKDKCEEYETFQTPEDKALYNIYMRKTRGGKYEIMDLTKEPWRNSYDKKVRDRVRKRLQCQLDK